MPEQAPRVPNGFCHRPVRYSTFCDASLYQLTLCLQAGVFFVKRSSIWNRLPPVDSVTSPNNQM